MSPERQQFDIDAIKATVDLVELASSYTSLIQVSRRGEFAGPCPVCGGEDRFHVHASTSRFYCRNCRPRGGDAIDLVQLVHEVDFLDACQLLSDTSVLASRTVATESTITYAAPKQSEWNSQHFQDSAHKTLWVTQRLLMSREGVQGREYLNSRGLSEHTWQTYGLGFGQAYHPMRREQRDAIFIPWVEGDDETVTAIQHRFMDDDLGNNERYCHKPGSEPLVFGLQALGSQSAGDDRNTETLFIAEGEFNCMSLHQCGVEALSVGSEANASNERTLALLQKQLPGYQRLIFWFDNPAYAEQAASRLDGQGPFRKETMRAISPTLDANELLVAGELQAFVGHSVT